MAMNLRRVDELLALHHGETSGRLVERPPSELRRGEATERNFYILKVDLVGSTHLLGSRRQTTYVRLAHTFLSTVDRITQEYGADPAQVEYAGDGLLAYFPERAGAAEAVLQCCFYVNAAVQRIASLEGVVGMLRPRCRIVVHFAPLTVARIGPRANTVLSAIGLPLHRVSKIEKDIAAGVGWATTDYANQLPRNLRRFLSASYKEERVLVPPKATFAFVPNAEDSLFPTGLGLAHTAGNRMAEILFPSMTPQPIPTPVPQYEIKYELLGYAIVWRLLAEVLG